MDGVFRELAGLPREHQPYWSTKEGWVLRSKQTYMSRGAKSAHAGAHTSAHLFRKPYAHLGTFVRSYVLKVTYFSFNKP